MLADARQVARSVDDLRARASGLIAGLEAELGLAVDVMFPTARLVAVLEAFARNFPTVALRLRVEALGGVVDQVLQRACGLGISGPMGIRADRVEVRPLCQIELIPVCAPTHPLASIAPPLPASALHAHVQLVLTDRTKLTEGQDFGVISPRTWRLGDLGAKQALLCAGLGWGNVPAHMVCDDIRAGRLVRLDPDQPGILYQLLLIHRADAPPGPAMRWLAERLAEPAEVG
jgi:DNA-binding transcriptional LysR family regulator